MLLKLTLLEIDVGPIEIINLDCKIIYIFFDVL